MEDILKKIPEKSKAVWNRLKEDWRFMTTAEKAGVIAIAIIAHPAIALIAADYFGRKEKKLKEAVI